MEPKKNPKYDVHRHRGVILNVSLVVSIALVISAFQWAVPKENVSPPISNTVKIDEGYVVPITSFHEVKPVEKPKRNTSKKPVPVTAITEATTELEAKAEDLKALDQGDTNSYHFSTLEIPLEHTEQIIGFDLVETKPAPLGGVDGFRNLLGKNLKYPKQAIRNQIQGKVYVTFTISKTGEVSDIKIQKGIGSGCDEEAIRVITLSKWTPGKQRGKPVAVRMIQPIVFSLGL